MFKRVLFLTEELRVGGAETYFYKIENNIKRDNLDLYTAAQNGKSYNKIKYKDKYIELSSNIRKRISQIKEIVKDKKIDIIHANSLRMCLIAVLIKKTSKNKFKIIYTKHNITIIEKINENFFIYFVNKFVDKFLTVCDNDKNIFIEKGVKKEKIISIPNGTDLSQFNFKSRYFSNEKTLNIGILARLSEEKNHKFFIDIIEQLSKNTNVDFKAFIAGDGPLKEEIENQIKEKILNITMVGNLENPEKFLTDMDVSILVSTREVFPMTILEAMCVGNIVISIDVGGIKDCVVNGKTGYLMSEYNSYKFSEVIEKIYVKREENKQIILNARKNVEENFSLEKMIYKLNDLYEGDL